MQYSTPMDLVFARYLENIERALNAALPPVIHDDWKSGSFSALPKSISAQHIENLTAPCRALLSSGGKRWRPLLTVLCRNLAREQCGASAQNRSPLSEEQTYALTPLVEFVHTASLIHDDIEDSAEMRRGKPAAHIAYGLDTALNAGSWLYFEAAACIAALDADAELKTQLYSLYAEELRRLHLGQAMDIFWHRNPDLFPTAEEYSAMVRCKTGTLASLAAKLGFLVGGAGQSTVEEAGRIAAGLGEGFQVLDDVLNLTAGNPGKKRGDDIVEGKKSLPVLLHIKKNSADAPKISECMRRASQEGIESSAVEECIALLEKGGAIKEAALTASALIEQNSRALSGLCGNENTPSASEIRALFDGMLKAAV
ncbi:MAG: FPP/GGPP synthase family protein [Treponema sp.]